MLLAAQTLALGYFIVLTATGRETIGKRAAGLIVVSRTFGKVGWRRALARYGPIILYCASFTALYAAGAAGSESSILWSLLIVPLLFYWILADSLVTICRPRRRALHDMIAGTLVVRRDWLAGAAAAPPPPPDPAAIRSRL